jgi:hypothetical protein
MTMAVAVSIWYTPGLTRGQCPAFGLLIGKPPWALMALNLICRRNVSLDCKQFLISDEAQELGDVGGRKGFC